MKARSGFVVFCTFLALQAGPAFSLTVRSADILDGEVKNVDIGANAVTTDKILDFTVGTNDIANLAITSGKIAAGAVDDSKITGPISAAKINSAGLNADTVDGMHAADLAPVVHDHDAVYQKKYANVVVVATSGGEFTDPVAAVNSITDASAANPWLVKIMPGVYDIGTASVQMKPFVDIEGAGETVTKIVGGTSAQGVTNPGVVIGANDAELRQLTVVHAGGGPSETNCIAILNENAAPRISHVTAIATCAPSGTAMGIVNSSSSPVIRDTRVTVYERMGPSSFVTLTNAARSARLPTPIPATFTLYPDWLVVFPCLCRSSTRLWCSILRHSSSCSYPSSI